jgi:hypothetical protein
VSCKKVFCSLNIHKIDGSFLIMVAENYYITSKEVTLGFDSKIDYSLDNQSLSTLQ